MRRMLNTLFVTTQTARLSKKGENVIVALEGKTVLKMQFHHLDSIVCFGNVSVSPPLIAACGKADIVLSYLSIYGRFIGRFQGPTTGNVLLRRTQFRMADDNQASAALVRSFLLGKIINSRRVVRRFIRDHGGKGGIDDARRASGRLKQHIEQLERENEVNAMRGVEGMAARDYFAAFNTLLTQQKEEFGFGKRTRRPPLDPINALLSFVYTLLHQDVTSALQSVGLDASVGFLHSDRPGRTGLALDMMEELRPHLADRLVLSLINRRQVSASGFKIEDGGRVMMNDKTRRTVLKEWQDRKQKETRHRFLEEKIPTGLIPHAQALLLARHIRGDLDAYPAFVWS